MTDEDIVAAKLKGYNCLLKFKDGEELLLKVDDIVNSAEREMTLFEDVERFINGSDEYHIEYFPLNGVSITRDSIKYVRKI